ncbi:hypothetical protein N2152v2_008582 [Parachlorella kessleri]
MWDSAITDLWPTASSPSANEKTWPFTMDSGIPIDCTLGTGTCDAGETQPGLWEFPMENVQDDDGSVIASMDAQTDLAEMREVVPLPLATWGPAALPWVQLLRWMKNPVPASQYQLDCSPPTDMFLPGGHLPCPQPSGGCVQGTWNSTSCSCMCLYQTSPQFAGFCPDSAGTCTISKLHDFTVRAYYCPGTSPVPVPAA